MTEKSKALAKREDVKSLAQLEETYRGQPVNLILPKIEIGQLPAGTMIAVRSVRINKDDPSHTYPTEKGKRALTKYALDLMANAAGITWISEKRVDDRRHPHYCEFEVRGRVVDFDGTIREAFGTKTRDFREDAGGGVKGRQLQAILSSAKRKGRDPSSQIDKAREFMTEVCASNAKNRAVASILGIKRSYEPKELDMPFIIPKLVPDTSNPEAQKMVIAGMLGATEALFSRPEPTVIDGRLLEAPVQRVTVADENGDDDDDVFYDPETGEVEAIEPQEGPPPMSQDEPEFDREQRLNGLYSRARKNDISLKEWEGMVHLTTKKRDYNTLTAEDFNAIEKVIEARIANGA